jgi:hypothetical protein
MTYSDVQIGESELAWFFSPIFLRVGVKALLSGEPVNLWIWFGS